MKLLVVTGLSGGRQIAGRECAGRHWLFCIDNIPAGLLPRILDFAQQGENMLEKVAVVLDVRGCRSPVDITAALDSMDKSKITYQILFLDSADEVLSGAIKKPGACTLSAATRGCPPARRSGASGAAAPAVRKGRLCGGYLAAFHRAEQRAHLQPFLQSHQQPMVLTLMSFGFKYGLPKEADIVLDVRCLPNPFMCRN